MQGSKLPKDDVQQTVKEFLAHLKEIKETLVSLKKIVEDTLAVPSSCTPERAKEEGQKEIQDKEAEDYETETDNEEPASSSSSSSRKDKVYPGPRSFSSTPIDLTSEPHHADGEPIAEGQSSIKNEDYEEPGSKRRRSLEKEPRSNKRGRFESPRRRKVAIVPIGSGHNAKKLMETHPGFESKIWGFCEGKRGLFKNLRIGDLLLFISAKTNESQSCVESIAKVTGHHIVDPKSMDTWWIRNNFNMNGEPKTNVGFPYIVTIDEPTKLQWDKAELLKENVLKKVQSSMFLKPKTKARRKYIKKCYKAHNVSSKLTREEQNENEIELKTTENFLI